MKTQFGLNRTKLGFWMIFLLMLGMLAPVLASTLVEPGKFILVLKPGERITDTINVKNMSGKTAVVKAVVYDWTLNDQDQLVSSGLGSRKDSLYGHIKFNPRIFKLEPGMNQLVRFTITVPNSGSAGELRGIVFFEEETPLSNQGVNTKLVTRVGSTIYAAIAPVKLKLKLFSAKVAALANNGVNATIHLRNDGLSHARYTITYKVIDEKNVLIGEGREKERILLPDSQREVSFPVTGNFAAGKYNLLLEIKFFNTDKTLIHSIPFTITK